MLRLSNWGELQLATVRLNYKCKIFPEVEARPYVKDLPDVEVHILNSGHFLLEEKLDIAARLIKDFLDRKVAKH